MRRSLCLLFAVGALSAGVACATTNSWDDAYAYQSDPYMAPVDDDGLGYDAGLGVDPIYSTPSIYEESGSRYPSFVPNDVYFEFLGNMSFNGGGGRVQVTNAVMTMPFVDPKRAEWKGWHLDVKGTLRVTWIDCEGANLLDEDHLFTLGVQASVSRKLGERSQMLLGLTPQYSSDFDVMSHHNFFWGGFGAVSVKSSESLRYTLGLAIMPDSYRHAVLPVFSMQWRYNPAWELRVEGSRLSSVCVAHERFHWGPFFQWNTGIWTVHRNRETQQLRMTNCILGLGGNYDHKFSSGSSLSVLTDLGFTFNNVFRIRDDSGDHTLEKYRAHPGLYARFGCRLAF